MNGFQADMLALTCIVGGAAAAGGVTYLALAEGDHGVGCAVEVERAPVAHAVTVRMSDMVVVQTAPVAVARLHRADAPCVTGLTRSIRTITVHTAEAHLELPQVEVVAIAEFAEFEYELARARVFEVSEELESIEVEVQEVVEQAKRLAEEAKGRVVAGGR